jgi:hypothetical protein
MNIAPLKALSVWSVPQPGRRCAAAIPASRSFCCASKASFAAFSYSPARLLPASPILQCSRPAATLPHGSAWCRNRTRAAARSGSAVSHERVIAICDRYWWSAPWRSSDTPSGMAPSAPGSSSCSPGARQRSPRSRWRTRPPGWSGR